MNIEASGSTNQIELSTNTVKNHPVPIPPLAEQKRIVAKVDELMGLCVRLEAEQKTQRILKTQAVQSTLYNLTSAESPASFGTSLNILERTFGNWFDDLATVKHLRATILQLAVQGKLVPQDPDDEPACELLKRIEAEKKRLVKEGFLKKPKPLSIITEDDQPFNLPNNWEWINFGSLADFINGDRGKNYPNKDEYVVTGVPWINTGHIELDGTLCVQNMNYITRRKFDSLRGGKIQKGDLVYCLRGATFGKTAFVEPYDEGAIASSLMIIRPHMVSTNRYIYNYLISPLGRSQIFRFDNGSAQPNLSANSVTLYAFPLPPLAEQKRIVAKVDELMALCDQLEAQITKSQTLNAHLMDSLIHQMAEAV